MTTNKTNNNNKAFKSVIISAISIIIFYFLVKKGLASDDYSLIIYSCLAIYFLSSVYTYFTTSEEANSETKYEISIDALNQESNEIYLNAKEDEHEIEIAKREENLEFSIETLTDIKDNKPEPNESLKNKLAFKSNSVADIDFEKVEKDALAELADFEKTLQEV